MLGFSARLYEIFNQHRGLLQHSQKFTKKTDAAVVSKTRMITGDFDIPGRIWHFTNS
jgi:hypothetical protein